MDKLLAFIGGALVGATAALLLTPMSGEELRARIKSELRKRGFIKPDQIDELVEIIARELETKDT